MRCGFCNKFYKKIDFILFDIIIYMSITKKVQHLKKMKTTAYIQNLGVCVIVLAFIASACTDENLLSIMDSEKQAATISFPGTENAPYWTSTEWTAWGAAVYIDYSDGTVNADEFSGNLHYVRCVANVNPGGTGSDVQEFHSVYFPIAATGQRKSYAEGDDGYFSGFLPSQSFQNNNNGTVTDLVTGLIWTRCSLGPDGIVDTTPLCTGVHQKYIWADAVNACLNLKHAGRSDWFLPTLSELASLVDYGRANPAIR